VVTGSARGFVVQHEIWCQVELGLVSGDVKGGVGRHEGKMLRAAA
jgi:allophanate hydrolase subunit 2